MPSRQARSKSKLDGSSFRRENSLGFSKNKKELVVPSSESLIVKRNNQVRENNEELKEKEEAKTRRREEGKGREGKQQSFAAIDKEAVTFNTTPLRKIGVKRKDLKPRRRTTSHQTVSRDRRMSCKERRREETHPLKTRTYEATRKDVYIKRD